VNRGGGRQIATPKIIVPKADHQTLMIFFLHTEVNILTHRQQLVKYSGYILHVWRKFTFILNIAYFKCIDKSE